jgi:putrescine aminotransferase
MVEGRGIMVKDSDGKEYVEACVPLVATSLGYGRKEIVEAAMTQMTKLHWYFSGSGFTHPRIGELAAKIAEVVPANQKRFFFVNSGSEANDTAVKLARLYWQNKGKKDKLKIISRFNSYHGNTIAMTSCTGMEPNWDGFGPLLPEFVHTSMQYCYRCPFNKEYPNCDIDCAKALEQTIEKEGEDTVAAFISDIAPSGSGFPVPPAEYFPMVKKICSEHNILFICDEVLHGFGRTGKWWGLQNWNVEPDMMVAGKAMTSGYLPMAMVTMSEDIYQGAVVRGHGFYHTFTFAGHPVCCAVAIKCIEIIQREHLLENITRVGEHLRRRLAEFKDFPHVGDVRCIGLTGAIELVKDKTTKERFSPERHAVDIVIEQALQKGFIFSKGEESIRIAPAYIATIDDIDNIIDNLIPLVANLKM